MATETANAHTDDDDPRQAPPAIDASHASDDLRPVARGKAADDSGRRAEEAAEATNPPATEATDDGRDDTTGPRETAHATSAASGSAAGGRSAASGVASDSSLERLAWTLAAKDELSNDAQDEAARIFDLLVDVDRHPDARLMKVSAGIALRALTATPPNMRLAQRSRQVIEARVKLYKAPIRALRREAPSVFLLFGLVVLILFVGFAVALLARLSGVNLNDKLLGLPTDRLLLVFFFGALGSGVSILQRVQRFDEKNSNTVILFATGLTKPVVGAAFALFLYVLVRSGILAIDMSKYDDAAFFAASAFVAGFSERLVPDLAKRAEGLLVVPTAVNGGAPQGNGSAGDEAVHVLADPVAAGAAAQQAGQDHP